MQKYLVFESYKAQR